MIKATKPQNESLRLKDIRRLQILDTLPEKDFDDITKLASEICGTPVSLISIIDKDRQWFKSKHGVQLNETEREVAFCNHLIADPELGILEVENALEDERFAKNPLTQIDTPVIAYTGIPLISDRGFAIGTLCTIDHKPKKLTKSQKESLKILATQVVRLFELRKANNELKKAAKENKKRYEELEMFAGVVSHDMKSPLANIVLTVDTLKKKVENSTTIDDTIKVYLDYIKTSSMSMNQYIEGILEYYKSDHTSDDEIEFIKLRPFLKRIIDMLNAPDTFKIKLPKKGIKVHVNKTAFGQIILNLVANSIKYCDKEKPVVNIEYKEDEKQYMFMIKDNGPGIKEEDQDKIFELFNNLNAVDRNGQRGTGIGLATVKKLVEGLEGEINICSTLGEGTTFTVIIPKPYEMTVIV